MPTYTQPSDSYDIRKGYKLVRWGQRSKVLQAELSELQKLLAGQTELAAKSLFAEGFLSKTALTFASGTLTVPADTIHVNGNFVQFQNNMTISTGVGVAATVYLAYSEVEVAYTDTIKNDGNLSGGATYSNNGIFDSGFGMETSRRVQRQIQLVTSNSDGTKKYLPVASISSGGVVTDSRVQLELTALAAHRNLTTAHGSTSVATAGAIAQRDGSGRAQFADPSAPADAATKNYTDALRNNNTLAFSFEVRTSDPATPATGRAWFRSDL